MWKWLAIALMVLLFLFPCVGRAADAPKPDAAKPETKAPISYQKDVLPLLTGSCMGCHTPEKKKGGLDMTSYSMLAKGWKEGVEFLLAQRNILFNAENHQGKTPLELMHSHGRDGYLVDSAGDPYSPG